MQWRDLTQDSLALTAIQRGINPYLRITELSEQFQSPLSLAGFDHPTPHSPVLLTVLSALSGLSEEEFHTGWLFGGALTFLVCAIFVCILIRERGITLLGGAVLVGLALNTMSIGQDLDLGQHNALLLPIVLLLWRNVDKRPGLAGIALGACLALRGFGFPFLLAFVFARKVRGVLLAVLTFVILNCFSMLIMGPRVVIDFFLKYSWVAVECWRGQPANLSFLSFPAKLFGSHFIAFGQAHAICQEPWISEWILLLGPLTVIGACVGVITRRDKTDRETYFAHLLILSIFCSPLTWPHYFVLLMPSALIAAVEIKNRFFSDGKENLFWFICAATIIFLFHSNWTHHWYNAAMQELGNGHHLLSNWQILLSSFPTLLAIIFLIFCPLNLLSNYRVDKSSLAGV